MRKKARKKSQTRGEKCNRRTTYVEKSLDTIKKKRKKKMNYLFYTFNFKTRFQKKFFNEIYVFLFI